MARPLNIEALFDRALQTLRGLLDLLDDEQRAIRARDTQAVLRLSRDKEDRLEALAELQERLQRERLPSHLPAHDFELLLARCQQQNRTNGQLMNLHLAQRPTLPGLRDDGYGARGETRIGGTSRSLVTV